MSEKQFVKFNLQDQSEVSTSDSTTPTPEPKQDLTDEQIEDALYENLRIYNQQLPTKKYKLVEINPQPKQDWKEDLDEQSNLGWKDRFELIKWVDERVAQPLQSQNEALQKEVDERNDKIFELIQKNNIQEKENTELKEKIKDYTEKCISAQTITKISW